MLTKEQRELLKSEHCLLGVAVEKRVASSEGIYIEMHCVVCSGSELGYFKDVLTRGLRDNSILTSHKVTISETGYYPAAESHSVEIEDILKYRR